MKYCTYVRGVMYKVCCFIGHRNVELEYGKVKKLKKYCKLEF